MRYLLTGGGSGGHIYPLLSIAEIIQTLDTDATFLFVGKKKKMEGTIVPAHNIPFQSIAATGTKGKVSLQNINAAWQLGVGFVQAKQIIRKFQPDICIGAGGYVSVPIMLAAQQQRSIVTAILETDQFMGRANVQLAKKSDLIFSGMFDLSQRYFPTADNYYQIGHPRSAQLGRIYAQMGTKNRNETHITFIGGSLGAQTINEQAIMYCRYQQKHFPDHQSHVTLVAGERYYKHYKAYMDEFAHLTVLNYTEKMVDLYQKTDLLICRAGAGQLAEAAAFQLPAILIPSPNVTNNHQYHNAKIVAAKKAAILIEESQIREDIVAQAISQLILNVDKRRTLSENIGELAQYDSVERMYHLLQKVYQEK